VTGLAESKIEKFLSSFREKFGFVWIVLVSDEGLALSQSGIEEQFELSSLLPSWVQSAHDIARSAQLEHGMGLVCLVPKKGSHALLLQDFIHGGERFIVLIATPKLPPKAAAVVRDICAELGALL